MIDVKQDVFSYDVNVILSLILSFKLAVFCFVLDAPLEISYLYFYYVNYIENNPKKYCKNEIYTSRVLC